jgi:hypothetical protein
MAPALRFCEEGVVPVPVFNPFYKLILFSSTDSARSLVKGCSYRRTFFDRESGLKTLTFFAIFYKFLSRCDVYFLLFFELCTDLFSNYFLSSMIMLNVF